MSLFEDSSPSLKLVSFLIREIILQREVCKPNFQSSEDWGLIRRWGAIGVEKFIILYASFYLSLIKNFLFLQYWGLNLGPCIWYHLSHVPSCFCFNFFSYFSIRVSCFCPGLALNHDSSYLYLSSSWDHRYVPSYSAYLLRWSLTNFLPGLLCSCDPPKYLGL
jgi:hypothetical protein